MDAAHLPAESSYRELLRAFRSTPLGRGRHSSFRHTWQAPGMATEASTVGIRYPSDGQTKPSIGLSGPTHEVCQTRSTNQNLITNKLRTSSRVPTTQFNPRRSANKRSSR